MAGYITEVDYDGGAASNFVEIAVSSTIDTSGYSLVIYGNDGTIIQTYSLGSPVNTVAGKNVYLLNNSTPNWVDIHNNEALALVDGNGNVLQFIAFKDPVTAVEGPADGMSATQVGQHSGASDSLVSTDGGATYQTTTTSDPGVIPCFAPGTLIATTEGRRPVEALRVGDCVLTLDGAPAEIVWLSAREECLRDVPLDGLPVLIRKGALGRGLPERDLLVSPQHRLLVGGRGAQVPGFRSEVLVPAKALVPLPGIRRARGKQRISWHHFACRHHNVVAAEGCYTESLLLGPMVLNRLPRLERKRLEQIFPVPESGIALNGPPALECIPAGKALRCLSASSSQRIAV